MKISSRETIYIGIDGGEKTGLAVWCKRTKQFLEIQTTTFWKAVQQIDYYMDHCKLYEKKLIVAIEDVSQNKPVFKLIGVYMKTIGAHQQKLAAAGKVAESVGRVKQSTDLLIKYCEMKNIETLKKRPGKRSMTKMNAEVFEKLTGHSKRTSEHGRDAAMLVFGY